jgi:hypothetical protein
VLAKQSNGAGVNYTYRLHGYIRTVLAFNLATSDTFWSKETSYVKYLLFWQKYQICQFTFTYAAYRATSLFQELKFRKKTAAVLEYKMINIYCIRKDVEGRGNSLI